MEARQVFEAHSESETSSYPEVHEYAVAACMYQQGDAVGAIEKTAGIYDDIIKDRPDLAPSYEEDGVMIQPEAAGNLEDARKIAAALTLQAACYFQLGQGITSM